MWRRKLSFDRRSSKRFNFNQPLMTKKSIVANPNTNKTETNSKQEVSKYFRDKSKLYGVNMMYINHINNILRNRKTRLVCMYKENLVYYYNKELLEKLYLIWDSRRRIKSYATEAKVALRPNLFRINKHTHKIIMNNRRRKKQIVIDKEQQNNTNSFDSLGEVFFTSTFMNSLIEEEKKEEAENLEKFCFIPKPKSFLRSSLDNSCNSIENLICNIENEESKVHEIKTRSEKRRNTFKLRSQDLHDKLLITITKTQKVFSIKRVIASGVHSLTKEQKKNKYITTDTFKERILKQQASRRKKQIVIEKLQEVLFNRTQTQNKNTSNNLLPSIRSSCYLPTLSVYKTEYNKQKLFTQIDNLLTHESNEHLNMNSLIKARNLYNL